MKRSPRQLSDSRGIVLLLTLGILGLLSVLAISFVSLSRLERSISRNYVDRTRAVLCAESGIESAVLELQSRTGAELSAAMACVPANPASPLHLLSQPSFASPEAPPAAVSGKVSGFVDSEAGVAARGMFKLRVIDESARLNLNDSDLPMEATDPAGQGRLFSLLSALASECGGGDPIFGLEAATAILTARVALGGRFGGMAEVEAALATVSGTDDVKQALLANLTLWSWQDPAVLRPRPAFNSNTGVDGSSFHITDTTNFNYPDPALLAYSVSALDAWHGDDIYLGSEFQHRGLEIESRAPVNVNEATVELLTAIFTGVQGVYCYENGQESFEYLTSSTAGLQAYVWSRSGGSAYNSYMNWPCQYGRSAPSFITSPFPYSWIAKNGNVWSAAGQSGMGYSPDARQMTNQAGRGCLDSFGSIRRTTPVDRADALALAQAIVNRIHVDDDETAAPSDPAPFESWQEFRDYLYDWFDYRGNFYTNPNGIATDVLSSGALLYRKYQADAILANCCPNSDLNDVFPNATLYRFLDKNDLLQYTTELCFEPTGVFRIESLGMIADGDSVYAHMEINASIRAFETARLTSQSHFFPDAVSLDATVDRQSELFGANPSAIATAGGWSDIEDMDAPGGCLTQSGPEALALSDPRRIGENVYDGYVTLASVQTDNLTGSASNFRASFNGTLSADVGWNQTPRYLDIVPDPEEVPTEGRLLFSQAYAAATPGATPGNLFFDGAYSEAYRTLMFTSENQFGAITPASTGHPFGSGPRGTISFWCKPNWLPERSTRIRKLFSMATMSDKAAQARVVDPFLDSDLCSEFMLMFLPQTRMDNAGQFWTAPGAVSGSAMFDGSSVQAPDRTFLFGAGGGLFGNGAYSRGSRYYLTDCANYADFPNPDANGDGLVDATGRPYLAFLGHRWSYFVLSWDFSLPEPSIGVYPKTLVLAMHINGNDLGLQNQTGEYWRVPANSHGFWFNPRPIDDGNIFDNSGAVGVIAPIGVDNPMRFGEYARGMPNFAADATFDEILSVPDSFATLGVPLGIFGADGRYYNNPAGLQTAHYTTPELRVSDLLRLSGTRAISGARRAVLRSVSWTLWWPDDVMVPQGPVVEGNPMNGALTNRNPDAVRSRDVNPNDASDPIWPDRPDPAWRHSAGKQDWDPMTVNLLLPDGSWLFSDADQGVTPISCCSQARLKTQDNRPIHVDEAGGVKLRFYFQTGDGGAATPMQDTPYLDDITLTYVLTNPVVLSWRILS